jgi:hypothetical protein
MHFFIHPSVIIMYPLFHPSVILMYSLLHPSVILMYSLLHPSVILMYSFLHPSFFHPSIPGLVARNIGRENQTGPRHKAEATKISLGRENRPGPGMDNFTRSLMNLYIRLMQQLGAVIHTGRENRTRPGMDNFITSVYDGACWCLSVQDAKLCQGQT